MILDGPATCASIFDTTSRTRLAGGADLLLVLRPALLAVTTSFASTLCSWLAEVEAGLGVRGERRGVPAPDEVVSADGGCVSSVFRPRGVRLSSRSLCFSEMSLISAGIAEGPKELYHMAVEQC